MEDRQLRVLYAFDLRRTALLLLGGDKTGDPNWYAAQQRSRLLAAKYRSGMDLDELRQAREMTQVHLARILGVNQAAVSKLERRADMYVSTFQDFVKAMGGELKIIAKFPDGTVEISQFENVKKAAAGTD